MNFDLWLPVRTQMSFFRGFDKSERSVFDANSIELSLKMRKNECPYFCGAIDFVLEYDLHRKQYGPILFATVPPCFSQWPKLNGLPCFRFMGGLSRYMHSFVVVVFFAYAVCVFQFSRHRQLRTRTETWPIAAHEINFIQTKKKKSDAKNNETKNKKENHVERKFWCESYFISFRCVFAFFRLFFLPFCTLILLHFEKKFLVKCHGFICAAAAFM